MIRPRPVSGRLSDEQVLHDQGNAVLVDYSPFWIALASQGRSRFGGTTAYLDASRTCRGRRSGSANLKGPIMCVYCKDGPEGDHEREACAASQGERCGTCGHGLTALPSSTLGRGRPHSWPPPGPWPKRTPLKKAPQPSQGDATKKSR